ncbi:hypothetical protein SVIOM342S_08365 [Streptomyces violaceorubidus]
MSPVPRRSLPQGGRRRRRRRPVQLGAGHEERAGRARRPGRRRRPRHPDLAGGRRPRRRPGSTVGVPWPRGTFQADQSFAVTDADGGAVPVQSWPLAHWPDGSLKWTAHAVGSGNGKLTLTAGTPAEPAQKITVARRGGTIDISTGVITASIGTSGSALIKSVTRGSTEIARNGRLVLLRQPEIEDGDQGTVEYERFDGAVDEVKVEREGPVRAVVRIDGKHRKGHRGWLPFSIRLYFYAA